MVKVSIIIPVYNVESYLRRCLDSVINQTLTDIEIICVNDCSPDNSIVILNEYAKIDSRIRIIDLKENRGVAVARNLAMKQAKGAYIGFVDSDDYVDFNFYEKLYNNAIETGAEVVRGNVLEVRNDKKEYCYEELIKEINSSRINFNGLFVAAIYNSNLIKKNQIQFIENCIYGEDRLYPLKASILANKLDLVSDTYYNYVRKNYSLSSFEISSNRKINDFISSTKTTLDFINSQKLSTEEILIILNLFISQAIDIISQQPESQDLYTFLEFLCEKKHNVDAIFKLYSQNLFIAIKEKNIDKIKNENNSTNNKIFKKKATFLLRDNLKKQGSKNV